MASAPNPIATTAIPTARPRRLSASVMTAAPAQATVAAAIVTRSSADRERQGDERREPKQRSASRGCSLERTQIDQ